MAERGRVSNVSTLGIEKTEVSNGEKLRISFPRISRKEFPTVGEFRHVRDSSASPPSQKGLSALRGSDLINLTTQTVKFSFSGSPVRVPL